MKKILLSLVFIASLGLANKLQAQCTLSNVSVNVVSANTSGPNCLVTIDLSFDISNNGGNKKIWLNIWRSTDYNLGTTPDPYGSDMPTLDELDGASGTNDPVAIIGINNDVVPPVYFTTYSADPTNINTTIGNLVVGTGITRTVASGSTYHFVLSGLTFLVPGTCAGLILQGDVWSSQASGSTPTIHCISRGISFFGDPTINGMVTCGNPRLAQVLLTSVSTAPLTVNYTVYLDKGIIGLKEAGDPVAIGQTANFTISATSPYNSGFLSYTGNNVPGDADRPLLIELNVVSPFSKTTYGNITNSCIPLPVQFNSFIAVRNRANVVLKWETIWEQNAAGFAVERNTNGTWQQVAYVGTQATGGNSGDLIAYQHIDVNNTKGISQYRIRQIDIDNRSKYSEIRSVRGESQVGQIIVYPNPSVDGKVNVSFEDAAIRDISVSDMSGRMIRQMKGVSSNTITIENLTPGMYNLMVIIPATGEQAVAKIVVNKR